MQQWFKVNDMENLESPEQTFKEVITVVGLVKGMYSENYQTVIVCT